MFQRPDFQQNYAALRFSVHEGKRTLVSELWVRRNGRIGVDAAPDQIRVPAYFFSTDPNAVAQHSAEGFRTRIGQPASVSSPELRLSKGTWRLELSASPASGGTVTIEHLPGSSGAGRAGSAVLGKPIRFEADDSAILRVDISATANLPVDIGDALINRAPSR
jgi:hypothetical protein